MGSGWMAVANDGGGVEGWAGASQGSDVVCVCVCVRVCVLFLAYLEAQKALTYKIDSIRLARQKTSIKRKLGRGQNRKALIRNLMWTL